jgi:hypothetical protein
MPDTLFEVPSRRRPGLIVAGAVLAVAGIVAALALWLAADWRYDDAIENLAPAPVGCDTTLEFDDDGTYYVFAETRGEVGDVDGDCESDDRRYDGEETDLDVVMFDDDDEELDLDRDDDVSYDNGESVGTSLYTVDIPAEGDYTLRVQGEDPDVVARVGADPNDGVTLLRAGAVTAGIVGVGLGAVLMVLGARKRAATPGPGAGGEGPGGAPFGFAPPTSPPSAPPPADRPAPPPWGPPGEV